VTRTRPRSPESISDGEIGRHRALLKNPRVKSWYDAQALRSRLSADAHVRKLGYLLEKLGIGPDEVVGVAHDDPDRLRDLLVRYAAAQKRAGRLDTYVLKSFSGLKSYLNHRRERFDDFPKLSPVRGISLRNERIPRPEELGRVLERLTLRGRVICLLMAHSGLRPGAIGSYGGENGLRLRDLTELKIGSSLGFKETPFVIRVPAELSKTRAEYVTFGTGQLATAILAYLDSRRERGDTLSATSPLIKAAESRGVAKTSIDSARFGRGFLTTKAVVEELRGALHSTAPADVTWRPYVLRSYCSTRLLLAEGQGRISRDLREAILGHDGGVASRYNVGKRWGEELLTEARREYANAAEFLETNAQTRMNVAAEFRRTLLAVAGLNDEEAVQHMNDSNDEVLALLRNRLIEREAADPERANGNGNGHGVQKPVSLAEAERLLSQGWTFVANFGDDRVLLQPPAGWRDPHVTIRYTQ